MPAAEAVSSPPAEAPATDAFREAMRHLAGAVAVVTTGRGDGRTGFTATSLSSLSIEPPTLLVCVNRDSSSWPVVRQERAFCVNLLAADQLHVADRFAGRGGVKGGARYDGAQWQVLATGALSLVGALVSIDCALDEAIERHSHSILIGRVLDLRVRDDVEPLLYWHGAYRHLSNIDRVLTQA